MGKITRNKSNATKSVDVIIDGSVQLEQALGHEADFTNLLRELIPSEYTLTVNAVTMSVATQEVQTVLRNLFLLYKTKNFKLVCFQTGNNLILKMQCNRIAKEVGLDVKIL